jgi:hypothetical protein
VQLLPQQADLVLKVEKRSGREKGVLSPVLPGLFLDYWVYQLLVQPVVGAMPHQGPHLQRKNLKGDLQQLVGFQLFLDLV